jgi:hypothetical protein
MPAKAKMRSSDVRATSAAAGVVAMRRLSASTKNAPPTAMSSSGASLATVAMELSLTPSPTLRTLTMVQKAKTNARTAVCAAGAARPGTSTPTLDENTVATAAVANVPSIHSSTPERNPAYDPNAVPIYA